MITTCPIHGHDPRGLESCSICRKTQKMITDHVWRPPADTGPTSRRTTNTNGQRPCGYMNCRRPRHEHQKAVNR